MRLAQLNVSSRPTRSYCLLLASGYLALALIQWRHSWGSLSQGFAFADLGYSRAASPALEICQTLTLSCLFALYLFCLVNWKQWKFSAREVAAIGVLPGLFAWSALPANSTDILAYIGLGRIMAIHGANPYLHTYSEFADFYSPFVEWDITMPYGPVVAPVFILGGWVSQYSVLGAVFVVKLVWLLTHCCNCFLLHLILKGMRSDAAYGLFLFSLNPLALLELIANGHNDGLLILFGLSAFLALQRKRRGAALWLALLSALVKLPGIFIWLAVLAYLIWRREWRGAGLAVLGHAALLLALKATLLPTAEAWLSMTNFGSYAENSLHKLLIGAAQWLGGQSGAPINYHTLYLTDRLIFSALFLGICLWRLWRIRELNDLTRELAYIFLALLIGYATWFFPWYVTWLAPLAALTEARSARWAIVVFSWTALALYAFPSYVVTEAPLHWLWGTLRILIVHLPPLALMARVYWSEHKAFETRNLI